MKHRHYEMICAKAGNMDLVVCINNYGEWQFGDLSQLVDLDAFPAFLCLPQHKEAVLNLLNGGESQVKRDKWLECNLGGSERWFNDWWYMDEKCESRIKPRKEKRWIALCGKFSLCDNLFVSKSDAEEFVVAFFPNNKKSDWQFIEIEVEV